MARIYTAEDKERQKKWSQAYYQANREKIKERVRMRRLLPGAQERESEYNRSPEGKAKRNEYLHRPDVRENTNRRNLERYHGRSESEKQKTSRQIKEQRQKPAVRERMKEYQKQFKKRYRKQTREYNKEYQKEYKLRPEVIQRKRKYAQCPEVKERRRVVGNLRGRMRLALKGGNKAGSTLELLGIADKDNPIEFLWQYLEKQFKSWMTRENYGKWHVDHIRPCSSFDLTDSEEQKRCFRYTNLQPLWAKENFSKNAKWTGQVDFTYDMVTV